MNHANYKKYFLFGLCAFLLITLIFILPKTNQTSFGLADLKLSPAVLETNSGFKGFFDGQTYKVTLKRTHLLNQDSRLEAIFNPDLTAWMSLMGMRHHAILLGNIPVSEEEVSETILSIINSGLMVTSLHNRFLTKTSDLMSLYLEGVGGQESLAKAMGNVLRALSTREKKAKEERTNPTVSSLNLKYMESLLWKGRISEGSFEVSVGRGTIVDGQELSDSMGVNSWATFFGSNDFSVVNGDIATIEFELPFVLKDLIRAGIQIVSIERHMIQEKPRLVFVHFHGLGKVTDLAAGVKAAIWEKEHFQSQ